MKDERETAGETVVAVKADAEVREDRMPLGDAIRSHVARKVRETKAEIERAKRDGRHGI